MSTPLITVNHISKSFVKGTSKIELFNNLSFSVNEGDFVALVGPSGSGKTTMLNLLAGFDRPTSGTIVIAGTETTKLSESATTRWRLDTVGFIFQSFNLISSLTALENVELPLRKLGLPGAKRRSNALRAMELVGLRQRASHFPRELSGGEEQRVGVARAIAVDPKLLLVDEPTGNLDVEAANGVLEILKTINEKMGKTILIVTHDLNAAGYAKRSLRLNKGVLESSSPEALDRASAAE